MIYKNTKGQLLIVSAMLLFAVSIFIYSQETVNTYKFPSQDFFIVDSLESEVCNVVRKTNGSNLPEVMNNTKEDTSSYCQNRDLSCTLVIVNTTQVPFNGNWSQHNYSLYNYSLELTSDSLSYNASFTC